MCTNFKSLPEEIQAEQMEVIMPLSELQECELSNSKKLAGNFPEQAPAYEDQPSKGSFWGGLVEDIEIGCPSEGSLENRSWDSNEPQPARRKITKKQLRDHLGFLHDKYFELVWYSRTYSGRDNWPQQAPIHKKHAEIEAKYPRETDALFSESGDWECGFNNGMLAGIRYVMTAMSWGPEWAAYAFHELDT